MSEFKIKTEEELYEMLGSLEKFNFFIDAFTEQLTRKIMLSVPALVIHHIKNEASYTKIKEDFFNANPELVEHKAVLGQQLNIIAAEHTDWTIEQVFNLAGIEAKKIIKQSLEANNVKGI